MVAPVTLDADDESPTRGRRATRRPTLRARIRQKLLEPAGAVAGLVGRGLDRPVFVIGSGRCGTTLLTDVLDSHPGLVGYPDEANHLWHPVSYPFEASAIATAPIEADPAAFTAQSLAHWPRGHEDRIRRVFAGYRLLAGGSGRLFVKSAMISHMVPTIDRMFPDAFFVHLYRNGPSVVASYMKKNFGRYTRYRPSEAAYRNACAAYWNDCLLEIDRAANELRLRNGRFHELSYEALCDAPGKVLSELTAALGIDPNAFGYDLSRIRSTNYKVGEWAESPEWASALERMRPAMRRKGYV